MISNVKGPIRPFYVFDMSIIACHCYQLTKNNHSTKSVEFIELSRIYIGLTSNN